MAFCSLAAQNRYATERLRGIALALGLEDAIAAVPDGDYHGSFSFGAQPLHTVVQGGEVKHIGLSLPPRDDTSHAFRFIERAVLEKALYKADVLPLDWDSPDEAFIATGSIEKVLKADTASLSFTRANVQGRQYQASWVGPDGDVLCMMVFPIDYSLITGATLREIEHALFEHLQSLPPCAEPLIGFGAPCLRNDDAGYTTVVGPKLEGSLLENAIYLSADTADVDDTKLIFDPQLPVESLSNAISSTTASQGIAADVKMLMYGASGHSRSFTMPLSALVGEFLRQGCTPYCGVMEGGPGEEKITLAVKMVNRPMGYLHLLKVTAVPATLFGPEPRVEVTLAAYVNDKTTQDLIYE